MQLHAAVVSGIGLPLLSSGAMRASPNYATLTESSVPLLSGSVTEINPLPGSRINSRKSAPHGHSSHTRQHEVVERRSQSPRAPAKALHRAASRRSRRNPTNRNGTPLRIDLFIAFCMVSFPMKVSFVWLFPISSKRITSCASSMASCSIPYCAGSTLFPFDGSRM
jgi:hypothetical protein